MVKLTVKIVSMQDADKFNKLCSKFDCDMDLQSGKYYVDAKSIMGIFSLDLSKPLILNADTDDEAKVKESINNYTYMGAVISLPLFFICIKYGENYEKNTCTKRS